MRARERRTRCLTARLGGGEERGGQFDRKVNYRTDRKMVQRSTKSVTYDDFRNSRNYIVFR